MRGKLFGLLVAEVAEGVFQRPPFNTLDVSGQNLHDKMGNVVGSVFTKGHYIHSTVDARGLQPEKCNPVGVPLYQC